MEIAPYVILSLGAIFCAYRAVRSPRLLASSLFLAVVSALVSVMLFLLGATEVAVIELSVGAGLVTVLLVYALSVVGEDAQDPPSVIPKPLAFVLVVLAAGLIGWMALPLIPLPQAVRDLLLVDVLWKQRALDVWIQVALIFSGVLGILGLLTESKTITEDEIEPEVMESVSAVIAHQEAGAHKVESAPEVEVPL
jgi:uncharacterized MnhB-related membrane protein